jgi:iron complex transport system substrate-binding protein
MHLSLKFPSVSFPLFRSAAVLLGALFLQVPVHAASVTDVSGRTVQVPAKVERIVLGFGVFPAFAAVEGPDTLARVAVLSPDLQARTPALYAALQQRFPDIGKIPTLPMGANGKGPTPEQVLALKPDVAIFGGGDGPVAPKAGSLQAALEAAGVPVIYVDFRSHPGRNTVPSIRAIARLIGREAEGEKFVRFHEQQLRRVTDVTAALPAAQKPRLFLDMRAGGIAECCGTPGDGNYGDFISAAGAINVGAQLHQGVLASAKPEAIAAAQPQIYVAGGSSAADADVGVKLGDGITAAQARDSLQATVANRAGVNTLPAVQAGRVYGVWHNFYNHPFNVVAVQALAKIAHPERFQDLDPDATLRDMARQFLHVDLDGTYWVRGAQAH